MGKAIKIGLLCWYLNPVDLYKGVNVQKKDKVVIRMGKRRQAISVYCLSILPLKHLWTYHECRYYINLLSALPSPIPPETGLGQETRKTQLLLSFIGSDDEEDGHETELRGEAEAAWKPTWKRKYLRKTLDSSTRVIWGYLWKWHFCFVCLERYVTFFLHLVTLES